MPNLARVASHVSWTGIAADVVFVNEDMPKLVCAVSRVSRHTLWITLDVESANEDMPKSALAVFHA